MSGIHGRVGGYAPGSYANLCLRCDAEFYGAKRAVHCRGCAAQLAPDPPPPAPTPGDWQAMENAIFARQGRTRVLVTSASTERGMDEARASARVMAAGKQMLEALQAAEAADVALHEDRGCGGYGNWHQLEQKADKLRRAVLARIGGTP